jgi:hypothetical protein
VPVRFVRGSIRGSPSGFIARLVDSGPACRYPHVTMTAHFQIPLDLPHAGTIAWRIQKIVEASDAGAGRIAGVMKVVTRLREVLEPIRVEGENPFEAEAPAIVERVARMGRELVDEIEKGGIAGDRLGQCVRNLFECLELGEEGARISLRAGENPDSALRPVETPSRGPGDRRDDDPEGT